MTDSSPSPVDLLLLSKKLDALPQKISSLSKQQLEKNAATQPRKWFSGWEKIQAILATGLAVLWTSILSLVVLFSFIISPKGGLCLSLLQFWARNVLKIGRIKLSTNIGADSHLNLATGYLYVSNHESAMDIIALYAALPQKVLMVAKHSLRFVPIIGLIMKLAGFIFINRGHRHSAYQSLTKAAIKLKHGRSLVIFPEGTYGISQELLPFKRGGFVLAQESNTQVIPVGIYGTRFVLPADHFLLRPGTITVRIGSPLSPPAPLESIDHFRQQVREEIERLREKAKNITLAGKIV